MFSKIKCGIKKVSAAAKKYDDERPARLKKQIALEKQKLQLAKLQAQRKKYMPKAKSYDFTAGFR